MNQYQEKHMNNFRTDYATSTDFCKAFESDMKSLYLLAFLLTANHNDAEQCFVATVDAAFEEQAVFTQWARSWVRRSLVTNAIQIVSPKSGRGTGKRDLWNVERSAMPGNDEIDGLTRLAPLQRFIFVMSILERYSAFECSVLLGCDMRKVVQARMRALRRLAEPDALVLDAILYLEGACGSHFQYPQSSSRM